MRSPINRYPNAKPPKGGFVYEPEVEFPGDVTIHEEYREALHDLVDGKFLKSRKYSEQQWRGLRIGVNPVVIEFTRVFVARMRDNGIPVFPVIMLRSVAQQWKEYREGDSKARPDKAPHVWGCAVDIVHSTKAWALSPKQWEFFGHVGKELCTQRNLAMDWGGDWAPIRNNVGWDPAHWQLRGWRAVMTQYPWAPERNQNYIAQRSKEDYGDT